jgi:hypothetical protein
MVVTGAMAGIEALEGRTLMSVAAPLAAVDVSRHADKAIHQLAKVESKVTKEINKLAGKFGVNLGQLVNVTIPDVATNALHVDQATGNVVGTVNATVKTAFGSTVVPIDLEIVNPAAAADGVTAAAVTSTPILNLHLGPIDLNLLGLHVKTSEICLSITAESGPGNLLGNLLSGLANLLNAPTLNLGSITSLINQILPLGLGLNLTQLAIQNGNLVGLGNLTLTGGGTTVSVPITANLGSAAATPAVTEVPILHLSVGPLDLNLLGLRVQLNNCATPAGPVTVDITAITGPGNLLGNLLAGIARLLG